MNWKKKNEKPYRLTPCAVKHLREIARYSQRHWGKEQTRRYLKNIEHRLDLISGNHHLGKPRPEIGEGILSFPCGRHIIFYLRSATSIDIIGIVHQDMDVISDRDIV